MNKLILLSSTLASIIIVGCGGGSSSSTDNLVKVSGTVPGTLIEAFCDDNYYASTTSIQNGTNKHPFEIEVPSHTNCRFVMTTNENNPENRIITPIGFDGGNTIVLSGNLNLGNIPLKVNYHNIDDKDGDHVVDTDLPIKLNGVSTNNSAVHDHNNNGIIDNYDDDDDNNIVNAYDDDDHDGIANMHDEDYKGDHSSKNDGDKNSNDNSKHNGNDADKNSNDNSKHNGNDADKNSNDNSKHNGNDTDKNLNNNSKHNK